MEGAKLTHENITSGTAATRALLPVSNSLTSLDTIVSSHSLSTAFGRAVAYTAILEGTSFATTDSTKLFSPDHRSSFFLQSPVRRIHSCLLQFSLSMTLRTWRPQAPTPFHRPPSCLSTLNTLLSSHRQFSAMRKNRLLLINSRGVIK